MLNPKNVKLTKYIKLTLNKAFKDFEFNAIEIIKI